MKNRPMGSYHNTVTEWDDNILFDADDPDFCNISAAVSNVLINNGISSNSNTIVGAQTVNFKVPNQTNSMLMASVQGTSQFNDRCISLGRNSLSMSSSLSDLVGSPLEISAENVLTIEELRQQMGSCFTCGVSWTDDHVSLDCQECGGYSLERPCPLCDGQCGVQWKRDFTMSHACGKARWVGVCPSYLDAASTMNLPSTAAIASAVNSSTATSCATAAVAATQLRMAHELCARLEQLSASTHI